MPPLTLSLPQPVDGDNSQYEGDSVVLRLETATVEEMNSLIGNQGFWAQIWSFFVSSDGLLDRLNRHFRNEPNARHIYPINADRGFERSTPTAIDIRINKSSDIGTVRDWLETAGVTAGLDRTTSYHDNVTIGQIVEAARLERELRSIPMQSPLYRGWVRRLQWYRDQRIPVSRWRVSGGPYGGGPSRAPTQYDVPAIIVGRPAPTAPIPQQQVAAPAPIVINQGIPSLDNFMNTLNEDRKKSTVETFKQRVADIQTIQEECVYTREDIILNKNSSEANNQKFIMILDSHNNFMFFFSATDILSDLHRTKINPNGRQRIVAIAEGTFAELLDSMKNHVPESDKGDPFWETGVATLEATPGSPTNKPH